MRELYIVYEDYMGRKDIIGIFKEIVNAIYDYQVECKDKTNKEFLDKQLQKISDKLLDK